jgi:hypothetical protein
MINSPKYRVSLFKAWPLILILLIGFLLRIKGLTWQSLWLDELHTMNEADPSKSWGEMFHYLRCCDQHPPLFFITERLSFALLGHHAFAARFVSVLTGTLSIWAMYGLGKELLNKRLGLIAATLTCVNFFNISYSQEARPYIFAFLFVILSFTWFIRLVKEPSRKNVILYSLFSLLLLYSHYYSLFIMAAQGILALLFLFQEKGAARRILFRNFLFAALIIAIAYLPWLSFLKAMTAIKSFWIQDISPAFLQNFFFEFFGNADILEPLLLLLLFVYVAHVAMNTDAIPELKNNPLLFGFVIFLIWIFLTLLIPYIRSLITVPMLLSRYAIVVLPAILLIMAWGIELFKKPILKYLLTILFVVLSLVHLFFTKKYYSTVSKTQFREMTKYIVDNNQNNYPVINDRTGWHQTYYLREFGSKAKLLNGSREKLVDSFLAEDNRGGVIKGFWIAGAHGDKKMDDALVHRLDSSFMLVKEKQFLDAWAGLYISRSSKDSNYILVNYDSFTGGSLLADRKLAAIWNGSIVSGNVPLQKGNYSLQIFAYGDKGGGEYPRMNVYANDKKLGAYLLSGSMEEKDFILTIPGPVDCVIKLELANDFAEAGKGDRNIYVQRLLIVKR